MKFEENQYGQFAAVIQFRIGYVGDLQGKVKFHIKYSSSRHSETETTAAWNSQDDSNTNWFDKFSDLVEYSIPGFGVFSFFVVCLFTRSFTSSPSFHLNTSMFMTLTFLRVFLFIGLAANTEYEVNIRVETDKGHSDYLPLPFRFKTPGIIFFAYIND